MADEKTYTEEFEEEEFGYKYSKTFQEVYTYCKNRSQHFLTESFDNFEANCIQYITQTSHTQTTSNTRVQAGNQQKFMNHSL